jgi:hypothetical protein
MKFKTLEKVLTVVIIALLTSCSNGGSDNNTVSKGTFKLGTYNYENDGSVGAFNASVSDVTGRKTVLGIFYSKGKGNSPFTMRFDVVFNTHASGEYIIKSENTRIDNENEKFMQISVTIADESSNASIYTAADTNLTATVTLIDSKYHLTIPNEVLLTKTSTGASTHPNTFTFTCNDVY